MAGNLFSQKDSISIRSGDLSIAERGIRVIVGLEVAGVLLAIARFTTNSYVPDDFVASVPSLILLSVIVVLIVLAAPSLWRFEPRGYKLTYWLLSLQLICVLGPRISYAVYFPFIAWVGFLKQGFNVQIFGFGFDGITSLRVSAETTEMPNALGINLAAIGLMVLSSRFRTKRERALMGADQIETIGRSTRPTTDEIH